MNDSTARIILSLSGGLITILLAIVSFFLIQTYQHIDDKLDNDVFLQYVTLIEERNDMQRELNKENIIDHKEILTKLDALSENIYELKGKIVGYESLVKFN